MIRKLLSLAILLACIATMQIGCGSDDDEGNGPVIVPLPRVVVAAHMDPTFDDAIDSPVWDSIDAVAVPIGTKTDYNAGSPNVSATEVQMKALIAGDSVLYIWAQWSDVSESNRFGQLHATYAGPSSLPGWDTDTTVLYNEDRIFILFDNGATSGADCASYCHGPANSLQKNFYGSAGDDVDIWQWRAQRTGIVSYALDMHLTDTMITQDPYAERTDEFQHGDTLIYDNYFFGNENTLPAVHPFQMHIDGPAYEGPGLLQGDYVGFDKNLEWVVVPGDTMIPPYGKDVPGYYFVQNLLAIQEDKGSIWDVRAVSDYDAGLDKWTVVFRRLLTTADVDDIDFSTINDSLEISIGLTNNSGIDHKGTAPFYMIFQ